MADGLPGSGRDSQPTVLASGRPREALQEVPVRLFADRVDRGDGVLVVTTRDGPGHVVRRLTDGVDAIEAGRVALVDCTTKEYEAGGRADDLRWEVQSPVAFAQTAAAVDDALAALHDRGTDRIHVLFDTLTTQFRLADADVVLQHTHDLAMTVGTESGLAVFTIEHAVATDRQSETLKHLFDVHLEVRGGADDTEVRWTGLLGGSDGWVPLGETGVSHDPVGEQVD